MAVLGEDDSSFCPSNDRLVDRYLRAKIDGKLSDLANAAYFVDADVCSARPQDLVRAHSMPARVPSRDAGDGQQFYFFSPARFVGTKQKKRSRTIDGTGEKESWHAEDRPKPVEGSAAGGYMTKFSYHVRIGPKLVEKPGWIMTEYTFKDTSAGDTVLCKVYKSPRGPGGSTKSGCKRKAADDLEEATPSTRQRQMDEDDAGAMLFAADIERDLQSVRDHATAPEFREMLHMDEESLPEPHVKPPSVGGDFALEELEKMITEIVPPSFDVDLALEELQNGEVENRMTTLQVPDGEDLEAYHKRFWDGFVYDAPYDPTVQTAHGPLTDAGVIGALATGVTVDELLLEEPSKSCLHPGGNLGALCT